MTSLLTLLCGMLLSGLALLGILASPAMADEAAARLRMAALLEEAGLLLEELTTLDPTTAAIDEEGRRLRKADQALAQEAAQLGKAMEQHNAAAAQLQRAMREHRQRCPRQMSDDAAIEACNVRGAELVAHSRELDAQHADLAARRVALNQRVELHNGAWRAWQKVRREHAPRLDTNEADAQHWVDRAVPFMAGEDFAALASRAGNPAQCRDLRLHATAVHSGVRGMRRLHACLAAVSAVPSRT